MSLVGTKNITSASTEEKIRTLSRTRPELGRYLNRVFEKDAVDDTDSATKSTAMDRYTRNVMQTLFSAEIKTEQAVASTLSPIASGIRGLSNEITHDLHGVQENLNKLLAPVSSATGQTLGTLANVARNPLGAPFILANSLTALVDKVNPDFANKMDATFKKYKMEEMANFPGQVLGSVRNLAMAADVMLSVPFAMAADIYNGAMEIIKEISAAVDNAISSIFKFFFGPKGVLDSIVPISMIMEVVDAIGELGDVIGVLGSFTGGFDQVLDITNQITSYGSQFQSFINNPADLAMQYLPPEVNETLGALRNPNKALTNLIPPTFHAQLQKISTVPGLGFVGNLGYSIGGTLDTLSHGVLNLAAQQYQNQLNVIGPFLNMDPKKKPIVNLQETQQQQITPAPTNPNISTVQGVPVQQTPRQPLAETKKPTTNNNSEPELNVSVPNNPKINSNTPTVSNNVAAASAPSLTQK